MMIKNRTKFSLILLIGFIVVSCDSPKQATDENCTENITSAIEKSGEYLVNSVNENGSFKYRINTNPQVRVKQRYNILRHAGTIYSLAMYYRFNPNDRTKLAMIKAGRFLKDKVIAPATPTTLAVWSDPKISHSSGPLQAKLGGTGLGLVALLEIEKISPGFTSLEDLQALGRFIVFMQKKNGSFYSKFIPAKGGRQDNWTSLYYPGEATLGLIMLYEKDPNELWLKAAIHALEYLSKSRAGKKEIPADHWAVLATEQLLNIENETNIEIPKAMFVHHVVQIIESIIEKQIKTPTQGKYHGGFDIRGKTSPTATRLEALIASYAFLPDEYDLRSKILESINLGIAFLNRTQIKAGKYAGAIPRAAEPLKKSGKSYSKSFNRRSTEVRIDYVQHALGAMIRYAEVVEMD